MGTRSAMIGSVTPGPIKPASPSVSALVSIASVTLHILLTKKSSTKTHQDGAPLSFDSERARRRARL